MEIKRLKYVYTILPPTLFWLLNSPTFYVTFSLTYSEVMVFTYVVPTEVLLVAF